MNVITISLACKFRQTSGKTLLKGKLVMNPHIHRQAIAAIPHNHRQAGRKWTGSRPSLPQTWLIGMLRPQQVEEVVEGEEEEEVLVLEGMTGSPAFDVSKHHV